MGHWGNEKQTAGELQSLPEHKGELSSKSDGRKSKGRNKLQNGKNSWKTQLGILSATVKL